MNSFGKRASALLTAAALAVTVAVAPQFASAATSGTVTSGLVEGVTSLLGLTASTETSQTSEGVVDEEDSPLEFSFTETTKRASVTGVKSDMFTSGDDIVVPDYVVKDGVSYTVTSLATSTTSPKTGCFQGLTIGTLTIGSNVTSVNSNSTYGSFVGSSVSTVIFKGKKPRGITDDTFPETTEIYYTVRFFNGSTQIGDDQTVKAGEKAETPTLDPIEGMTYVFDPAGYAEYTDSDGTKHSAVAGYDYVCDSVDVSVLWQDANKIRYTFDTDATTGAQTAQVVGVASDFEGELVIPEAVSGYTVTSIAKSAFEDNAKITRASIPASVSSIGYNAFSGCSELTEATIADGSSAFPETTNVVQTPAFMFSNCEKLETVHLPNTAQMIPASMFAGCTSLKTVNIPEGVTTLRSNVFNGCTSLEQITLPSTLTSMSEAQIFMNCTSLKSISIPAGVTSLGTSTFSGCTSLEQVDLGQLTGINTQDFKNCTSLKSVTIPNSVTTISDNAFDGAGLTSIVLSSNITELGKSAFANCVSLTKAVLDTPNATIGKYLFQDCTSLTDVELGEGMTATGQYMFSGCTALTGVKLPSTITTIDSGTFYGCSAIKDFEIASTVTTINSTAFYGTGLEKIVIPSNVKLDNKSSYSMFASCKNLESIVIDASGWLSTMMFQNDSSLKNVSLGSGVTGINKNVFKNDQLETLTVTSNLGSVDGTAFASCTVDTVIVAGGLSEDVGLEDLLPDSVFITASLDETSHTAVITKITAPEARTVTIPNVISCGSTTYEVTGIASEAGSTLPEGSTVVVPSTVDEVASDAFPDTVGQRVSTALDDGTSVVFSLDADAKTAAITGVVSESTGAIVLPDTVEVDGVSYSVTSIKEGALASSADVTSVTVPASVETIDFGAFTDAANLSEVVFEGA